jgi:hypothetical protein
MSRSLLFVLLLATSVALAEDAPKAPDAPSATAAKAHKKKAAKPVPATGVAPAQDASEAKSADGAGAQGKTKEEEAQAATKEDRDLGMSILGNQEAPKALVIVPWKRSEIGNALGISTMLDDSRLPIDKEVFMRMLSYYEIRSETALHGGAPAAGPNPAPAGGNAAQSATAAHRRRS